MKFCFVTALIFRGCAEAMYEHDFGCDNDMQVRVEWSGVIYRYLMIVKP